MSDKQLTTDLAGVGRCYQVERLSTKLHSTRVLCNPPAGPRRGLQRALLSLLR